MDIPIVRLFIWYHCYPDMYYILSWLYYCSIYYCFLHFTTH